MDNCRSCGAPIVWATSQATGKPMPLDPDPAADGNLVLMEGEARVLTTGERLRAQEAGTVRYKSHFATCPDATKHRRPK
jgi:hypothetical protein